MLLKLQFFWELTEGGSPPSFSRAFSSTWQGLSALPHTRIGQILASLANSCLGASICPMRVWLASCRFALALSQTFNVCWEYGQICACVSPYFPTFPDISCPPKESISVYCNERRTHYRYCSSSRTHNAMYVTCLASCVFTLQMQGEFRWGVGGLSLVISLQ